MAMASPSTVDYSMAEHMAARLFGPRPSEKLTQEIMAMMLATNPAGAAAAVRGRAERPDYQPVLKALRAPSLVCAGDHDSYSTAVIYGHETVKHCVSKSVVGPFGTKASRGPRARRALGFGPPEPRHVLH